MVIDKPDGGNEYRRHAMPERCRTGGQMAHEQPIGSTMADRSLQIATALSAEVVVLRERLEIVERLLAAHGLFGPAEIDGYRPEPAVAAGFAARRRAFLERIFGAMRVDREPS
jgi:hypothetical protein